jgi:hypothetical protein
LPSVEKLPNIKKAREWYENLEFLRNVLLRLGWWKPMLALFCAAGIFTWSYLKHLSGPNAVGLALLTLASILEMSIRLPDVFRRTVKVKLTPASGPAPMQVLNVQNLGAEQTFRGECTLLQRRNDPNLLHASTFRMGWDGSQKRAIKLRRGGSCNLVVAIAEEDRKHDLEWIGISSLSTDDKMIELQRSEWNRGDNRYPEYDIEICIVGDSGQKPKRQRFTVRRGKDSALEMFAIT